MPKQITSVLWEASPPDGLTFDSASGTFSGTPSLSAGEYEIPVKVTTNYGSDEKDLKVVIMKAYPVYAIGANAETWSEGATPDANGFRKLSMPNASRLVPLFKGFGAKVVGNKWYVCGGSTYGQSGVDFTTPIEYPVNNVVDMAGNYYHRAYNNGAQSGSISGNYFFVYTSDGELWYSLDGTTYNSLLEKFRYLEVTSKLRFHSGFSNDGAILVIDQSGQLKFRYFGAEAGGVYREYSVIKDKDVKTFFDSDYRYILTSDGELYSSELNSDIATKVELNGEVIRDIYVVHMNIGSYMGLFAVTSENKLYAKGKSNGTYNQLGLPNSSYTELTEVGNFDVKKIASSYQTSFLLTNDGELYHAGRDIPGIEQHSTFTQIFSEYRFQDISYSATSTATQTLVVTMEE